MSSMKLDLSRLPADFPDFLKREEEDSPVPSWEQVTRSLDHPNAEMIARVSQIVAGDEQEARAVWDAWPPAYRRSTALLIDKITHEGWLDCLGPTKGVWDGGMFFRQVETRPLAAVLDSKPEYTRSRLRNGLVAYLNSWSHKSWAMSWMENDAAMAALHVGIFKGGSAEVHFDLFNPLYTQTERDVFSLPLLGAFNHRLFRLHHRWERGRWAEVARRSANLYHLMRREVPLSF
jgi:hypothetical protein